MGFGFQWHLTDLCNLRCRHCYQDRYTADSRLDRERLATLVDRLLAGFPEGDLAINLTGGEPLLLAELPWLIDRLHESGRVSEQYVITNGTLVQPEQLEALARCTGLTGLKVSIESGVARVNDALRGAGNLCRVEENIDIYRRVIDKPLVLMVTLGRVNLATIEESIDFARRTGVSGMIFERFVPLGRGRQLADGALTAPDWREAVTAIAAAADLFPDEADLWPFHAFWLHLDGRRDALQGAPCNLGVSMALMPDGTVFPCRRLPVPVGNVLAQPMAEIRTRLTGFAPDVLRTRLHGNRCRTCPVPDCAGCRALAATVAGDWLADDPRCLRALESEGDAA